QRCLSGGAKVPLVGKEDDGMSGFAVDVGRAIVADDGADYTAVAVSAGIAMGTAADEETFAVADKEAESRGAETVRELNYGCGNLMTLGKGSV
ncbi:hypothetical protein GOODEAATRI_020475, partial [Goodea atripinnis]